MTFEDSLARRAVRALAAGVLFLDTVACFCPTPVAISGHLCPASLARRTTWAMSAPSTPQQPLSNPLASVTSIFGGLFGGVGERRAELKKQLSAAVELNQGREARVRVEGILEQLIGLGGRIEPRAKLPGVWQLIWSSQTADSFPLAKPTSVLGGDCLQRITAPSGNSKEARVENLVIWPFLGGLTLNGGATLETVDDTRSILRIDSFALELGTASLPLLELTKIAAVSVNDAPIVKQGSQLVSVSTGNKRVLNTREGFLDLLYFDEEGLRVTRSPDNGLIYLHLLQGSSLV